MKSIIFFGGVAYNGKSTIINNITNIPQTTTEAYSFDNARDYIISNQTYFFTALNEWNPIFKTEFLHLFTASKHKDIVIFLQEIDKASQVRIPDKNSFLYMFSLLKDYSALRYITKQMRNSSADYFIIEGSFINRAMRKATYDFFAQAVEGFNQTKKYFFYMNMPLKTLLRRKEKTKLRKEKSVQVKKSVLKKAYLNQEIIEPNELDNIEIHIIKSIKESNDIPSIIFNSIKTNGVYS